jgi:hypothetical protein
MKAAAKRQHQLHHAATIITLSYCVPPAATAAEAEAESVGMVVQHQQQWLLGSNQRFLFNCDR